MNKELFIELYNFVDDVNALIRKLSAENIEMAGNAGLMKAIDTLYDTVEREGLGQLEDK